MISDLESKRKFMIDIISQIHRQRQRLLLQSNKSANVVLMHPSMHQKLIDYSLYFEPCNTHKKSILGLKIVTSEDVDINHVEVLYHKKKKQSTLNP